MEPEVAVNSSMRQIQVLLFGALLLAALGACSEVDVAPTAEPVPESPPRPEGKREASPEGPGDFVGVLLASETVDIAAPLEAPVSELRAEVGARVAKGDVLATLDVDALKRELQVAEARLGSARAEREEMAAELGKAEERKRRRTVLSREGLATEEDASAAVHDERIARARSKSSEARIAEQRAMAEQLRAAIERGVIRAPFSAIVAARMTSPGALARVGDPLLRIMSTEAPRLRFAVPEARRSEVFIGARLRGSASALVPRLEGVVEWISPEVEAGAGMVLAEARLFPFDITSEPTSGTIVRVTVLNEGRLP